MRLKPLLTNQINSTMSTFFQGLRTARHGHCLAFSTLLERPKAWCRASLPWKGCVARMLELTRSLSFLRTPAKAVEKEAVEKVVEKVEVEKVVEKAVEGVHFANKYDEPKPQVGFLHFQWDS